MLVLTASIITSSVEEDPQAILQIWTDIKHDNTFPDSYMSIIAVGCRYSKDSLARAECSSSGLDPRN